MTEDGRPLLANMRSPYDADMKDMLVIPSGARAEASVAIARSSESQSIVDHSIRRFLFLLTTSGTVAFGLRNGADEPSRRPSSPSTS